VLPGIQAVVDKGFVDENAIGIHEHSWGDYQWFPALGTE
jgi:hypothetical protein